MKRRNHISESSQHRTCKHCGDIFQITSEESSDLFCCDGCMAVYYLLQEVEPTDSSPEPRTIQKKDFSFLDQIEFRSLYLVKEEKPFFLTPHKEIYKLQFYLEGIHCLACLQILESLSRLDKTILQSELRYSDSLLTLYLLPESSLKKIAELLGKMGYKPHPLAPGQSLQEQFLKENRKDLSRIGVAGAITGNIMLFSISIYGGLTGSVALFFHVLSCLLFLPLFFFSAQSFFQGALQSLRFKVINIDLPIVIALVLGFILSVVNLFLQRDQVYFDSMSGFIFLILSSRYLTKRIQQKALNQSFLEHFIKDQGFFLVSQDGNKNFLPLSHLKSGQKIWVPAGKTIPADGILHSHGRGHFDLSLLTGESLPQVISFGMPVLAGTHCSDQDIEILVTKTHEQTQLGEMLSKVEQAQNQKTPLLSKADRASQYLIFLVLMLAIVFLLIWLFTGHDFYSGFDRAFALIIVACPCALALGAPLAISRGLQKAVKQGILLRQPEALEKFLYSKTFSFDKTGTLTKGQLQLSKIEEIEPLTDTMKQIILTLERKSHHPLATAFRRKWGNISPFSENTLVEYNEEIGKGVSARFEDHFYAIQSDSQGSETLGPRVALFKDQKKIMIFQFEDEIREEAISTLAHLRKYNHTLYLLSGDHHETTKRVGLKLGFQESNIFGGLSPVEKRNKIESLNQAVVIGDGMNDTLSMSVSFLSIAVQGSAYECLKNADIYFSRKDLTALIDLRDLSRATHSTIFRNIVLAFIYNSLAGIAALSGVIGPLGSAVLMPISSLIILFSSFKDDLHFPLRSPE